MVQSATPLLIPKKAQDGIISYHRQCYQLLNQQWNIREQMRQIDLAYIRENDWTVPNQRARFANIYGDTNRLQNVQIPVVMPAVESAVEYQTSVFLTGNPIFGVVASPEFEDEALQMESVIDENATRGGWTRELMLFFRDGFKYNISFLEADWAREVTPAFDTDLKFNNGKQGKPKEVIWEGNRVIRWDPYNTFFDSRVQPTEIPLKGEFIGKTELMGRVQLKGFINSLPDKMVENITAAFNSGMGSAVGGMSSGGIESYFLPQLNPMALVNKNIKATTDWMAWAGVSLPNVGNIQYKNLYEVTTMYGRILPSDFGLSVPSRNTPQVWKFIIVNHQVLIYAMRLTNAHGLLPVLVGQPLEDGLSYQTKSLATNVRPIQEVSSALMNSVIAARRRAISDRALYDPSRVAEHHINSDNPSAKIPVRPSAYGKPVGESVYQFPFRDDQSQIALSEIDGLQKLADRVTGQNPARQGQFVKGNKTLHEYADVMQHANGRDQMTALLYEYQIFTPLKQILRLNILQYQGGVSIFNPSKKQQVNIDPIALRKAVLSFKVSDGLIPSEKLISSDQLTVGFQTIQAVPALQSGYNIVPMFSYLMKTQGADLRPFERSPQQAAYEQALNAWQQMAQLALEKGRDFKQPQPKPQDYGYDPSQNSGSQQTSVTQPPVSPLLQQNPTENTNNGPTT